MNPTHMEYYGTEEHDHDMMNIVPRNDNYKIIAKFNGDWLDDLDTAIGIAKKVLYEDRGEHSNYLYDAQADALPKIGRMATLLGFDFVSEYKIKMQRPGCLMSRHIDPYKDPKIQVLVTLSHWEWGQFIFVNNSVIRGWKPGEVIFADWNNSWHCTCNCSSHTRPLLQITGVPSQKLKDLISSGNIITIDL
jgi:hypothetical protein